MGLSETLIRCAVEKIKHDSIDQSMIDIVSSRSFESADGVAAAISTGAHIADLIGLQLFSRSLRARSNAINRCGSQPLGEI